MFIVLYRCTYIKNHDGRTIIVNISVWPNIIRERTVRISNIVTPEFSTCPLFFQPTDLRGFQILEGPFTIVKLLFRREGTKRKVREKALNAKKETGTLCRNCSKDKTNKSEKNFSGLKLKADVCLDGDRCGGRSFIISKRNTKKKIFTSKKKRK